MTSLALTPGSTFTVEVNVTGAPPIQGFDISLDYNLTSPNVLQVVKPANLDDPLTGGLFDPNSIPAGCTSVLALKEEVDAPAGSIRYAAGWVGGCTVIGTGVILTFTFRVVGVGVTTIDVQQAPRFGQLGCLVGGPSASGTSSIACFSLEIFNGYFRNKPGIPPTPSFTFSPQAPESGKTINFTGTSSIDSDNPLAPNGGSQSEAIVYDTNDNKQYDAGEPVPVGTPPPVGSYLGEPHPNPQCRLPNCVADRPDQHITFVDANANGVWDPGETIVYDANLDHSFETGDSNIDFVITGSAPPLGSALSVDPKLTYYDLHPNNIWDNGYVWTFGDNPNSFTGNATRHEFLVNTQTPASGYFSVRLIVFDSDNSLPNRQTSIVHITQSIKNDVSLLLDLSKLTLNVGEPLTITVTIRNVGTVQNETAKLLVSYDSTTNPTIGNLSRIGIMGFGVSNTTTYTLQTSSLTPRAYTVTAQTSLFNATTGEAIIDSNPQDNAKSLSFVLQGTIPPGFLSLPVIIGSVVGAGVVVAVAVYVIRRRRPAET